MARAAISGAARGRMYAAGFRAGDIVHNTFSYHLVPAGLMMEVGGARHRLSGDPGRRRQYRDAARHHRAREAHRLSAARRRFLKILLDKGKELGRDVSSLKKALVGAEALPPSLRKDFIERGVFTCSPTARPISAPSRMRSKAMEGMIIAEDIIVEIVRPGTDDPGARRRGRRGRRHGA